MTTLSPLLVDAKKEYTVQLADLLTPYVMNTVARIYENSKKKTAAFRELLRGVPNWNASGIEERTNEIERRNPQLADLIAACCVSYTKVLGSIRLNPSQHSNVRIALPQTSAFVHSVYVYVAKEFFYDPKLVFADRHVKATLMTSAVEESIRQHVPIQQLLKAYLSVAVDADGMDPMAAAGEQHPPSPPPRSPSPQMMQQHQMMMHDYGTPPPPAPAMMMMPPPPPPPGAQQQPVAAPQQPQQMQPQQMQQQMQPQQMQQQQMPQQPQQPQIHHYEGFEQQLPPQEEQPQPQFFENVDEFD